MTKLEKFIYDLIFGKKKDLRHENELKWGKLSQKAPNENQLILGEGVYSDIWKDSLCCSNNTLVIGSGGIGTRYHYIEPNLLSGNTNYVIVDFHGEMQRKYAETLKATGFDVKCVDISFQSEDCVNFNPFTYLETEKDICVMADILIESCATEFGKREPFYDKQSEMVLRSLICYVKDSFPKREQSLYTLYKVFDKNVCAKSDDPLGPDMVENYLIMMKEYCEKFPAGFGALCYRSVREGSTRLTLQSTLLVLAAEFFSWIKTMYNEKQHLAENDGVDFTSFRDKKSVLFLNISEFDRSFNSYYKLCIWQAYNSFLQEKTIKKQAVHFILDGFGICCIPDINTFLAVGRPSGIITSIIIQNLDQLKQGIKNDDKFDVILSTSKNILYFGGGDLSTYNFILDLFERTASKSGKRYVLAPDELMRMPAENCIIFKRGDPPYYTKKFDLLKYPIFFEKIKEIFK